MTLPPIVLVHGAWHGPWCWDELAAELRTRGHEVVVPALPGHQQPGDPSRIWNTARSYVDAVADAIDALDRPPVLVGHSMGGYVVQRYCRTHQPAGIVLLASLPRSGVARTTLQLLRHEPGPTLRSVITASLWPLVSQPGAVARHFFGPTPPPGAVRRVEDNLQNESYLAFLAMLVPRFGLAKITSPALVVAAGEDALFSVSQQQDLADVLSAPLQVIQDSGHDLMLDAQAAEVTDLVDHFVRDLSTSG